jgi:hypothetical protein
MKVFAAQIFLFIIALLLIPAWGNAQSSPEEPCNCLDILFVIDDTSDMADVVANLQVAFSSVIWPMAQSICGDVRFGIISFKDDVTNDLAFTSDGTYCQYLLNNIVVDGGGNGPEASDQALLEAFDMAGSVCTIPPGFDPSTWREECCKVAVLLTSSAPGGCDDTLGPDDWDNGLSQSILAASMDIMITAVYETGLGRDPEVADQMARYAANTDGLYAESLQGAGIGDFIVEGILKCSQETSQTEFCCVQVENTYCVETMVGLCGPLGGDVMADCGLCFVSDTRPGAAGSVVPTLHQCSPNPFNPQTTIALELPKRETVTLRVFDMAGRLVKNLITAQPHTPGRHEVAWNGRDDTGRQVASGTYFYRMEAGPYSETKRMVLIK